MEKRLCILGMLFILISITKVFPGGVNEETIPSPKIKYEIPEYFLGTFIIPSYYDNITITIFPSNKYIMDIVGDDYTSQDYGHVVYNDGDYYLVPLNPKDAASPKRKLSRTENGFSFLRNSNVYFAIRRRDINLSLEAKQINIQGKELKEKYFLIGPEKERVEYFEISPSKNPLLTYYLSVKEGMITINYWLGDGSIRWKGYIEVLEINAENTKGKIIFTEGSAYVMIENATGEIEIEGGNVQIRLPYKSEVTNNTLNGYPNMSFPQILVLNFNS